MKTISVSSLFVSTIICFSYATLEASEDNRAPFRGSIPYNTIHAAATVLSYPCGLLLGFSTYFAGAVYLGFHDKPLSKIGLVKNGLFMISGPVAGATLICGTPRMTNKLLYHMGYLTKEEASYTKNETILHCGTRLLVLLALAKYMK